MDKNASVSGRQDDEDRAAGGEGAPGSGESKANTAARRGRSTMTESRASRRARESRNQERDRRRRRLALISIAKLVETDETINGATLILPNGSTEFFDAETLRREALRLRLSSRACQSAAPTGREYLYSGWARLPPHADVILPFFASINSPRSRRSGWRSDDGAEFLSYYQQEAARQYVPYTEYHLPPRKATASSSWRIARKSWTRWPSPSPRRASRTGAFNPGT